jgi:hypothetical protein
VRRVVAILYEILDFAALLIEMLLNMWHISNWVPLCMEMQAARIENL